MEGEPKISFEELVAKVERFKAAVRADSTFELWDKSVKFARHLQDKYPNYNQYRIYHVLIASSDDFPEQIREDFPGEDSIESFIDNLIGSQ